MLSLSITRGPRVKSLHSFTSCLITACPNGCIFPWERNGQTYNGCAKLSSNQVGGNYCPTKLNNAGSYYGWKICDESCPVHVNDNDWKFSGISQLHPFIPTSTKTTSTSVSYENCAIT